MTPRPTVWVDRQGGEVVPGIARRVRELVAAEATDDEIGVAIGHSTRVAKRVRLALGLLHARSPADVVADATLRRLHADGLTNAAIAEETGLTHRTVQERLSRLGLKSNRARRVEEDLMSGRLETRWLPGELDLVRTAAERAGVTVAEFVRRACLAAAAEETP